jgi:hypothetical protein
MLCIGANNKNKIRTVAGEGQAVKSKNWLVDGQFNVIFL